MDETVGSTDSEITPDLPDKSSSGEVISPVTHCLGVLKAETRAALFSVPSAIPACVSFCTLRVQEENGVEETSFVFNL